MPTPYEDARAQCPYYIRQYDEKIKCEGYLTGTIQVNIFRKKEKALKFYSTHCCEDYSSCPLAQAITKKYED